MASMAVYLRSRPRSLLQASAHAHSSSSRSHFSSFSSSSPLDPKDENAQPTVNNQSNSTSSWGDVRSRFQGRDWQPSQQPPRLGSSSSQGGRPLQNKPTSPVDMSALRKNLSQFNLRSGTLPSFLPSQLPLGVHDYGLTKLREFIKKNDTNNKQINSQDLGLLGQLGETPKENLVEKDKNAKKTRTSFKRDDTMTTLLLRICQEYQKKHGHGQPMGWQEIVKEFNEKTGCDVVWKTTRSKFEHIKRFWRVWDNMKNKESGVGWDDTLNVVKADPSWWDKKIKENPDYKKFRQGIKKETTDLWTDVFGGIVATGRRCVAPTMDPSTIPLLEGGGVGAEANSVMSWKMLTVMRSKVRLDVDITPFNLRDGCQIVNSPEDTEHAFGIENQLSQGKLVPSRAQQSSAKCKGKGKTSGERSYNQHMSDMINARTRLFEYPEDDGSSPTKKGRKVHDLDDAMALIEKMVEKEVIAEGGEMWCVAMGEIEHEASRELFMRMKSDFARTKWLRVSSYKQERLMLLMTGSVS